MSEREIIGESAAASSCGESTASVGQTIPAWTLSVYDRAAMLERMMGDEELAAMVLGVFLDDLPRQIALLKEMVAREEPDCGRQAHAIKGAAANVGGERLTMVALGMEKAADRGDLSAVRASMASLEAEFAVLREMILAAMPPS